MPGSKEEDFKRNNAFSLYDIYGQTLAQEPLLWGHKIYNFGKPYLGHHYYIFSLSDLCIRRKKIFKRNNAFSLFDLYGHAAAQEPRPGVMKFTSWVDPSLVIITITYFVWNMPLSREEYFVRNTSILHFLPKNYLPFGWGVMKFMSPYPTDATYQICLRLAQFFLRRRCLRTMDDAHRTKTNANP